MKHFKMLLLVLLAALVFPVVTIASGTHSHDHGSAPAEGSDHPKETAAQGKMAIVGSMTSKGVKGMAHIMDVSDSMSRMGMNATHHFMIAFADEETGKQIETGSVALKLTNPDAKVSEPIELIGMDGHFGADLLLDMKGEYHFRLGTKLEDGTKRKYHFHYINK